MIPEVSKRPFRHPVPAEAIECFCHPQEGHRNHLPAWGDDVFLYACNGWVAARFFNFPPDTDQGPPELVERMHNLRWHNPRWADPKGWRKTDDCTLDLFKDGVWDMWTERRGKMLYRIDPVVRINYGILVPLVSLQLISRLPRCEIYISAGRVSPLAFRFNGGEGLIALLSEEQERKMQVEACHLFRTSMD